MARRGVDGHRWGICVLCGHSWGICVVPQGRRRLLDLSSGHTSGICVLRSTQMLQMCTLSDTDGAFVCSKNTAAAFVLARRTFMLRVSLECNVYLRNCNLDVSMLDAFAEAALLRGLCSTQMPDLCWPRTQMTDLCLVRSSRLLHMRPMDTRKGRPECSGRPWVELCSGWAGGGTSDACGR